MSLFERIKEKRISLNEQTFSDKQKSDMKKLLNKNFGSKEISKKTANTQKNLSKANKEVFNVTGKSAVRDAKKYSSGEYPKIGGGSRIGSKSKGPGAETGAKVNLNPTSGSKSKGNKPVTVSTTKTVKQSDISKQAKKFTKKINKKNINRPEGVIGDTYVSTTKKGKIRSAKKVNPTLKKSISQVKADIEFKQSLKKSGASGDVSDTAPKKIRDYVSKKREARATKLGTPDPFKIDTSKASKEVAKDLGPSYQDIKKGKIPKNYKLGGKSQFDISKTPVGKIKLPPKKISPEVQKKTFDKFSKEISDATKQTKKVSKKIGSIKSPKMPSQPETGFGGKPGSQPVGGTSGSSTKTVKQSKVSKQAKEFTQKINQKKTTNTAQKMSTVKGDPLQGNFDYDTSTKSTPKPKKPNVFKRVTAATSGKKGSALNPEISGIDFDVPKKTPPINVTGASGGGNKPPVKRKTGGTGANKPRKPRKITKKLVSPGVAKVSAAPKATRKITKMLGGSSNVDFYKSGSKLAKGISKVSPKAGKLALGATKTLAKLGTPGRIAATVGTVAALSPAARKGISGLAKKALAGAGLGGVVGASAASQKQSDKERIKQMKKPVFVKDKDGKEIKKVATMGLNLSDISKPKKKDKPRTSQSIATELDYLKKRQKVAPYGAKYTG